MLSVGVGAERGQVRRSRAAMVRSGRPLLEVEEPWASREPLRLRCMAPRWKATSSVGSEPPEREPPERHAPSALWVGVSGGDSAASRGVLSMARSARSRLYCRCSFTPQALQSVFTPAGPLRHSGVVVAAHWTHTCLNTQTRSVSRS